MKFSPLLFGHEAFAPFAGTDAIGHGREARITPASPAATARRLDVLLIEDDDAARRGLELSLGHEGFLVLSAPTLASARALLASIAIDVLVCDRYLPDGECDRLLDRWPTSARRVPTILISARPHRGDLPAHVDAFLPKPLDVDRLIATIRELAGDAGHD